MISSPFSRAAKKAQNSVYGESKTVGRYDCPKCSCFFFSMGDLKAHGEYHDRLKRGKAAKAREKLRNGWSRTKTRGIEKIRQSDAGSLVAEINGRGSFSRGGYRFWLFKDFVFRRRETSRY